MMVRERRDQWIAAAAAVVLAAAALATALVTNGTTAIPSAYEALGPALGRLATITELREDLVPRVSHGREFASASGRLGDSATDSLDVWVERTTLDSGRQWTTLHVAAQKHTGSDFIRIPWDLTIVVPNDAFVLSDDLSRISLDTVLCDERTGETKRLEVRWRMKGYLQTRPPYGELATRTGDATFTARFGDERIDPSLGSVGIQLLSKGRSPRGQPDPHVRVDGRRQKPVRCPPQR